MTNNFYEMQDRITSLQRDNEALRKELQQNKAKAVHLANALMVKEQGGGVQIVPAMEAYADTMVEEWKVKLAAAEAIARKYEVGFESSELAAKLLKQDLAAVEAKVERLKDAWDKEAFTQEEAEQCEKRMEDIFNEPPPTSLTNYIREQTKEVVELLEQADITFNPDRLRLLEKALAKLKEIRGEK